MSTNLLVRAAWRIVVPVAIAVFAVAFYRASAHLPFRAAGYPRFLILILLITIAVVVVRELAGRHHPQGAREDDTDTMSEGLSFVRLALAGGALLVFCIVTAFLGIRIGLVVFMPMMMLAGGYTRPVWIIVITAALYGLVEVVFIGLFRLPLPGVW